MANLFDQFDSTPQAPSQSQSDDPNAGGAVTGGPAVLPAVTVGDQNSADQQDKTPAHASNLFDQFDAPKAAPNLFDQFDNPPATGNDSPSSYKIQDRGALSAMSDKTADMASFGAGKYIEGAGAATANALKAPFTGDFSPGAAYHQGVADYEKQMADDDVNHPIASDIGDAIGFAGSFGKAGAGAAAAMAPTKELAGKTTLGKGAMARSGDDLTEAADAIKQGANKNYQAYRDAGAVLTPEAGQQAVQQISDSLGRISPQRHADTLSVLDDLKARAEEGDMSLEDLDDFRQDFRDVHNDHTDFTGKTKSDGRMSSKAIDAMDDFVDNLGEEHLTEGSPDAVDALRAGQQQWAQYKKFDAVANVMKQADGDPNRIKAGLTRFMNKPKNTRGWSDDEIEALQNAARNTTGEKLLKMAGKFGVDFGSSTTPGNTALPALTAFTGLGTGAGHGAVAVGAGTVARQGQKWLARGKAENLLQTIEGNAKNAAGSVDAPINKAKGGAVYPRPKSYPALSAQRKTK